MSQSRKTYAARLQKRLTGTVDLVTEATGNFSEPAIPVGGGVALGLVYLNRMVAEKNLIQGLRAYEKWRKVKESEHTVESILANEVLIGRLSKNHPHHDKKAQKKADHLAESHQRRSLPKLTNFISVVVKVVNQENKPLEIVPGLEKLKQGEVMNSQYLTKVWKIIAKTLGKDAGPVIPELIANTNGALSYFFMPIPWERKDHVVHGLRKGLEKYNFIPSVPPTRGPLSNVNFIEFQTFMHGKKLMPQLLITVVHYTRPTLTVKDLTKKVEKKKTTTRTLRKSRK